MIDSHTHLYAAEFLTAEQPRHPKKGTVLPPPESTPDGPAQAVERALKAGIEHLVFPANSLPENEPMKQLAARFPGKVSMAMGLHPTELTENPAAALDMIEAELRANPGLYCAVGEIGVDLYWEQDNRQQQMEAFRRQCLLALNLSLPIIIHCREALPEVLEVLRSLPEVPGGVFHSFGGCEEDVAAIREVGDFYFGINGIVTFKSSSLPGVLPSIGLDRILLETDSPYLAPVPFRGRRNESAYLPAICHAVAAALSDTPEQVDLITSANTRTLFSL